MWPIHTGLKAVIAWVFDATWQRQRVHWQRNALADASRGQHTIAAPAIRQAFDRLDRPHASETWSKVAELPLPRWLKLADLMDASEHDVLAYMALPHHLEITPPSNFHQPRDTTFGRHVSVNLKVILRSLDLSI